MECMTLRETIQSAVLQTSDTVNDEEKGGIILCKDAEYSFALLANDNTGTDLAKVLWSANRKEYGSKVIPMIKDGWEQYASFHTHPKFKPIPSSIDMEKLFEGFPRNYIYSPEFKTFGIYVWEGEQLKRAVITYNALTGYGY